MTHFEGDVTVYEPSDRIRKLLTQTIEANRVDEVVTVEPTAVGSVSDSSERIFGDAPGGTVAPADLPACDVLDLDCEGAELDIFRRMEVRPRVCSVEAHPHLGCSHRAMEAELDRLGYEVVREAAIDDDSEITNYVAVRDADRPED